MLSRGDARGFAVGGCLKNVKTRFHSVATAFSDGLQASAQAAV
ncbi:hypothetical protein HMPREF9123_1410 [Neisseria bacilliformis ATCC BAA-1200]|uniref:Uncharacterized protein n=1 Tax=Neisseria bacilliformis ATCC BAA-1200 TaxID=888742 RepID=F2BCF5_9NEIS|nr:hypothetical protein HMPREF9123_1410 [Neisseria bacilliformis ATCC BAA-1200]